MDDRWEYRHIAYSYHPELKFLVTPVGCGIAGYTPEEMAPMFKDAAFLENVFLPISFWKVLVGK